MWNENVHSEPCVIYTQTATSQQFWSVMTNLFHMTADLRRSKCMSCKPANDSESHILYPKFNINMAVTKITSIHVGGNINIKLGLESFILNNKKHEWEVCHCGFGTKCWTSGSVWKDQLGSTFQHFIVGHLSIFEILFWTDLFMNIPYFSDYKTHFFSRKMWPKIDLRLIRRG